MLSVAGLSSAGQAGSYYTKDNYYTAGDARETSQWEGRGAERAGLTGNVEVGDFERVLSGQMPDGSQVGEGSGKDHKPGMDMTFSAPKSLSLLAYIGGDERLLDANLAAVRQTLAWAEKNLAEARVRENGTVRTEKTGNLVVALFQHDTSRNLDPQAHIHAVIANATQTADGKWRALHNGQLWKQNSLLGAIYHSYLREKVEELGYETERTGKHGTFEIKGVSRDAVEAFSTRRQEILGKAEELGIESNEGRRAVTLRTRPAKETIEDRGGLRAIWQDRAKELGIDLGATVDAARARADQAQSPLGRFLESVKGIGEQVKALFGVAQSDPKESQPYYLAANRNAGKEATGAAVSVAAAVRHLAERETSFTGYEIAKAAMHLGVGTTIDGIENQLSRMVKRGMLIVGENDGRFTTPEGIQVEQRLLDQVERGRGTEAPIVVGRDAAGERVQAKAQELRGFTLNPGQEGAARLLLASEDRIVNVQGVAGAGKSSVLQPVAAIAGEEGRNVLALGVQNKLVAQLRQDTGIEAMTVAKFLGTHGRLLSENAPASQLELARAMFRRSVILVDEASMLSNDQADRLARLANKLEVGRLAFVGDARQLGAVEAGKPFEVLQTAGAPTAVMGENIRARSEDLRSAAASANAGRTGEAFAALRDLVQTTPGDMGERAANDWLSRSPAERESTLVMTSGRRLMHEVNERIQGGLQAEGTLTGNSWTTTVRDRVHATNEELKVAHTYEPGMVIEVQRANQRARERLDPGSYVVLGHDQKRGTVIIRDADGKVREMRPDQLGKNPDENIRLTRERELKLLEGDKIRWTDNDKERGLFNADRAKLLKIEPDSVTFETGQGVKVEMPKEDPMLKKLDLGYAMNTHQLQGATADSVIAVADSRETNLNTARMFLVNITRPRDDLTIYVDSADRYERNIGRNPGDKTSALESIGSLLPSRESVVPTRAAEPVASAPKDKTPEAVKEVPVRERVMERGM